MGPNKQQHKNMLRYKTELAWFSRLVRHPARKQSGSILTTPPPARGGLLRKSNVFVCGACNNFLL